MATLDSLKWALRQKPIATTSYPTQPLSDSQYCAGFDIFVQGLGSLTYQDFILPQLSLLLASLLDSRSHISVLEIGPGPVSVLGQLPDCLRQKVKKYVAFEPNDLFATRLEKWGCSGPEAECPLPCLESPVEIHRIPFASEGDAKIDSQKFDLILFCHSMYGMELKHKVIERALEMLPERPEGGRVVVFHRDGTLHLDGLLCHQTVSFTTGVVDVADDDEVLDKFAAFITGCVMQSGDANKAACIKWRQVCRTLGCREESHQSRLIFSAPDVMAVFTQHATALPELVSVVPLVNGESRVKNREARLHHPASIIRPTTIQHVQQCVRWALSHGFGLTVIGGGHSGHCQWSNVVAVDMGTFDQIHILMAGEAKVDPVSEYGPLVVVEAGCTSGDIICKAMAAGLTVPLGARPSVGAGLWLQGGIGHLARLHGLACDAIIGAVLISLVTGEVLYIGCVPAQHRPASAVRPENEEDILWAIKGAGTNFGIVISITFEAYTAPIYSIRNWFVPLSDNLEAQLRLSNLDECVARKVPRNCSVDAYLYWDADELHLGVTMFESSTTGLTPERPTPVGAILGPEDNIQRVDGLGLFEAEMYMSGMHGGHGGGKTSAFKRCLFLKRIGAVEVTDVLVAGIRSRPSPLCYLHLLQGGGAVGDTAADATAFGCREWDFACVITGVWPRDQDETAIARAAVQWVYDVARDLLPLASGAYGADLGPDPRDTALAARAFGPNLSRLALLKRSLDPGHVLAYACPLPEAPKAPKLIILVTGESGAGKDHCAEIWLSVLTACTQKDLQARTVSISDVIKREYAAATGTDLLRLLGDRAYKERHRPALSAYFKDRVHQQPRLPEENFLSVLYEGRDLDVLFVTGMRDEAPVAAFSHLVPDSRLLEVSVRASKETRRIRRGCRDDDGEEDIKDSADRSSLIFSNDAIGNVAAERFAQDRLLPFFHEDLQRLAAMVSLVSNFPRPGIEFRHVLDIAQQPGGLALCTSLLQAHFAGEWAQVHRVACCETGGFVYASALAARVDVPLALIRDAGKLPPPVISTAKSRSHISSSASNGPREARIEMSSNTIPKGASVVVVDDVLATGKTLCAVLQLLSEAGIDHDNVNVMVVAEFPAHCGRDLLRRRGFGRVQIQSLLVFGGR